MPRGHLGPGALAVDDLVEPAHRRSGRRGGAVCESGAVSLFTAPQVVLFSPDVERAAAFYRRLGFREVFRTPQDGPPIHVDVELDGYRLGLASEASTRDDHGLDPVVQGQRAAVVLWTGDTPSAYVAIWTHAAAAGASR